MRSSQPIGRDQRPRAPRPQAGGRSGPRRGVRARLRPVWRLLPALPVLFLPRVARAQRETVDNWNAWFILSGDVALTDRWSVLGDVSARRSGPLNEWQAAFARGGLAYALTPAVRVAAGMVRAESWPFGASPGPYRYPEWRSWQQAVFSHGVGRAGLSHRLRLEQRWLGRRTATEGSGIDHWMRASRVRYSLRATLPIGGNSGDRAPGYLAASNEMFVSFGANAPRTGFDQNRAAAVVGWRLSTAWRAEVGFLEQTLISGTRRSGEIEQNHTVTVSLSFTRPPPASRKRPA